MPVIESNKNLIYRSEFFTFTTDKKVISELTHGSDTVLIIRINSQDNAFATAALVTVNRLNNNLITSNNTFVSTLGTLSEDLKQKVCAELQTVTNEFAKQVYSE